MSKKTHNHKKRSKNKKEYNELLKLDSEKLKLFRYYRLVRDFYNDLEDIEKSLQRVNLKTDISPIDVMKDRSDIFRIIHTTNKAKSMIIDDIKNYKFNVLINKTPESIERCRYEPYVIFFNELTAYAYYEIVKKHNIRFPSFKELMTSIIVSNTKAIQIIPINTIVTNFMIFRRFMEVLNDDAEYECVICLSSMEYINSNKIQHIIQCSQCGSIYCKPCIDKLDKCSVCSSKL